MTAQWTPVEEVQVCLVHGRMYACRIPDMGYCEWTSDPNWVNIVRAYQQRGRQHWLYSTWPNPGWEPGDVCGMCGSTDTWEDIVNGACCQTCGATDADE